MMMFRGGIKAVVPSWRPLLLALLVLPAGGSAYCPDNPTATEGSRHYYFQVGTSIAVLV